MENWIEFKEAGLLWWINMILQTFGWSIVYSYDAKTNELVMVSPKRVHYRGFNEKVNADGYIKVSKYMNANSEILLNESKE